MKSYPESLDFLIKQQQKKRKDLNKTEEIFEIFNLNNDLLEDCNDLRDAGNNLNIFDFSKLKNISNNEIQTTHNLNLLDSQEDLIKFSDDDSQEDLIKFSDDDSQEDLIKFSDDNVHEHLNVLIENHKYISDGLYLIQNPCQFVKGKTEILMDIIINYDNIFIIIPQNSLADTKQIEKRCIDKFGSSKVWNITSTGINISDKNLNHLPKVIIGCPTHRTIIQLSYLITETQKINKQLNLILVIDECDKNISPIQYTKIFEEIKTIIVISATMTEHTYKKITDNSKKNLHNAKYLTNSLNNYNHIKSYNDKYHKIQDNNIIFQEQVLDNNLSKEQKQHHFITTALNNKETQDRIKQNRCYLFCPGFLQIKNHKNIGLLLKQYGFNILYLNTNTKFELNDGTIIHVKLNEFIYVIINKLILKYPGNFAIVGNSCVERGLTFNSKEYFNFTDHIFTPGICKKINKKIQMLSRSCGNKEFIEPHNIYITEEDYYDIISNVENRINIEHSKPNIYTQSNFKDYNKKNKEKDENSEYRIFTNKDDAKKFCKDELNYNAHPKSVANKRYTEPFNGKNPPLDYLKRVIVGLGPKNPVRVTPSEEEFYVVHWDKRYLKKKET